MSNQYPQQPQPGWNGPQQPGQPQPWGGPQPGWGMPPQPPKKGRAGKIIGFGCLGIVALFVLIGIIAAVAGGGGSESKSGKSTGAGKAKTSSSAPKSEKSAGSSAPKAKKSAATEKSNNDGKKKTVTFKVWGTAPAGALGPLDITYGSDSDNRNGKFANGKFEATLPLDDEAMYYVVTAQLQGSGNINCSVTVDGKTKKGHASGGYNICDAQLSSGLLGGWD
ncbi:hypothetical protein [Streptomyces sp. NPDC047000]|uniref:hypothetical protein n=1 Tax=Streptomyces sp. NPDC047000 TaxID=3155474 RepID=UPI0033D570C2